MLIDPQLIEDELISFITPLAAPLPVEPFPEKPEIYVKETMDSALGAVLVGVPDMRKRDAHEGGGTFQFFPQISVLTPGLRQAEQHQDAYAVIKRIVNGPVANSFEDGLDGQGFLIHLH